MIAARKVANQLRDQTRQKRGGGAVRGESVFEAIQYGQNSPGIQEVLGTEPTPALAAEVAEQCEQLLERLDDDQLREIARLKLEGYTNKEIAKQLSVQTRTVERKLGLIRKLWKTTLTD